MENYGQNEDSSGQMLSGDEQFEQWNRQHLDLQQQIEAIERRPYVTEADGFEEQRLKKQKLHLKDQMNQMLFTQRRAAEA